MSNSYNSWRTGAQIDNIYPVGSIYISVNSTNPGSLFGGTWEQIENTFLLAAGSAYTAGSTGGEVTHILTENELPSHTHELKGWAFTGESSSQGYKYGIAYQHNTGGFYSLNDPYNTGQMAWGNLPTGNSQAHNNMPPYLVVYMWK